MSPSTDDKIRYLIIIRRYEYTIINSFLGLCSRNIAVYVLVHHILYINSKNFTPDFSRKLANYCEMNNWGKRAFCRFDIPSHRKIPIPRLIHILPRLIHILHAFRVSLSSTNTKVPPLDVALSRFAREWHYNSVQYIYYFRVYDPQAIPNSKKFSDRDLRSRKASSRSHVRSKGFKVILSRRC